MITNVKLRTWTIKEGFEIFIPEFLYEEFEEEMNAIITYFKLSDYLVRIYYCKFIFTCSYENKGCTIEIITDDMNIIKKIEIYIGPLFAKKLVNVNMENNIIESLRMTRKYIEKM